MSGPGCPLAYFVNFYFALIITVQPSGTQSSRSLLLVSTWMGDRLRAGKPPCHLTGQPGQLSLAVPPWVG